MSSKSKMVAGCCGLALSVMFGGGIATAEPDIGPIVNSTCTYPQVMAALGAENPDVATQVSTNPLATGWLQRLVGSSPDGRRQMIQEAQAIPGLQQYTPLISQVATTCNDY